MLYPLHHFSFLSGLIDDSRKSSSVHINRDMIACMNSPHAFKYSLIYDIYQQATKSGLINEVEPHTTTINASNGLYCVFFERKSDQYKDN